jgi:hypothetical protein
MKSVQKTEIQHNNGEECGSIYSPPEPATPEPFETGLQRKVERRPKPHFESSRIAYSDSEVRTTLASALNARAVSH